MSCSITISDQSNNSLGACWLAKFEDDYTGELYDKCLYPKSDYGAMDALDAFISDRVADDEIDVEEIYLHDSAADDPDAASFAAVYKARFGIEYRNMCTAIHGIIVFEDESQAKYYANGISEAEEKGDVETAVEDAFEVSCESIDEIDYRDIEDIALPNGDFWQRYEDGQHGILIVNDKAFDLYL